MAIVLAGIKQLLCLTQSGTLLSTGITVLFIYVAAETVRGIRV